MYALGCTLYFFASGKDPFPEGDKQWDAEIGGARWTKDKKDFSYRCTEPTGPLADCFDSVAIEDSKSWSVLAGPFMLQTEHGQYTLSWDPVSRTLRISVTGGTVSLTGPEAGQAVQLAQGTERTIELAERSR